MLQKVLHCSLFYVVWTWQLVRRITRHREPDIPVRVSVTEQIVACILRRTSIVQVPF